MSRSWVGIDLDGCLAYYDNWQGIEHIGEPIQPIQQLVKDMLARGIDVRIFTARAYEGPEAIPPIQAWCKKHLGQMLPVTNVKDFAMVALIDDRAIPVATNAGRIPTAAEIALYLRKISGISDDAETPPALATD